MVVIIFNTLGIVVLALGLVAIARGDKFMG
jgi:hypothetical protein